jgi:chitinase
MTVPHRPPPYRRLRALTAAVCTAVLGLTLLAGVPGASARERARPADAAPADGQSAAAHRQKKVVGTYTNWSIYGRNFLIKDIGTSGTAARLTHIRYAYGYPGPNGCSVGDAYADRERYFNAAASVDGVADTWEQPLLGNFNQLRKLKKLHPHLKVVWSFGGSVWSGHFGRAAANAEAYARTCRALVEDPRWADVFDGIDIDWQYPNTCGITCDISGRESLERLLAALRAEFGRDLVTATVTGDAAPGGGLDAADYEDAAEHADWLQVMTYGLYGARRAQGPTAPHAPLYGYPHMPDRHATVDAAVRKLKRLGVPPSKLLLGISFEGHGWRGVTRPDPGGTATGPAESPLEPGVQRYRVLKSQCPVTGSVAGTAYAHCGTEWWSYDTPATVARKAVYAERRKLGGTFLWDLSGDTADGELVRALR